MKLFLSIGFFIIIVIFMNGCQKSISTSNNSSTSGNHDTTVKGDTPVTGNVSVYVAGFDNGAIVYWKDGIENVLAMAAPGYYGNATGIAVMNGDIYVTGYVGDNGVYWKNGMEISLSDPDSGTAVSTAISTLGGDIYIAGYIQESTGHYAAYWKNGVRTNIFSNSNLINSLSLALSGNDIYVAATIGNDTAAYWKNGTRTTLAYHYCYAYGIAVSGEDVYVVGVDNNVPVYWKNGLEIALPYTALSACYGIGISGSNLYITGVDNGNAVYWKNGTEKILEGGSANAITISGSDIYITGSQYASETYFASYWKNGNPVFPADSLSETLASAQGNAITVINN